MRRPRRLSHYPCTGEQALLQMSSDSPVCNAGNEGRSWQDTAGVVNGTLLIFTGPRAPGIANSSHGAKTSTETQSQGLVGESVHRSRKPFALIATATGDLIREKQKGRAS